VTPQQALAGLAALVLAGGLVVARGRVPRGLIGVGALGVGGLVALAAGLVTPPDAEALLEELAARVGGWAYALVPALAFLETGAFVGLVAPGETTVVLGGALAAEGEVALLPLAGLTWAAAAAGDLVSFLLGRRLGRPFLVRHGPRLGLSPARLARVDAFFDRHGAAAVLIGRFVGIVRATAPFLAGASGLALRRFLPWSLAGTGLWAGLFVGVGYAFAHAVRQAAETASTLALTAALALGVALLVRGRRPARRRGEPLDRPRAHARAPRPEADGPPL
jgi:membrane protein DedA with SNARE-associated domain